MVTATPPVRQGHVELLCFIRALNVFTLQSLYSKFSNRPIGFSIYTFAMFYSVGVHWCARAIIAKKGCAPCT